MEEAWEVCERFAKYGWPLHFTELTVLSGRYIGRNGMMNDDSKPEDWYRGKVRRTPGKIYSGFLYNAV